MIEKNGMQGEHYTSASGNAAVVCKANEDRENAALTEEARFNFTLQFCWKWWCHCHCFRCFRCFRKCHPESTQDLERRNTWKLFLFSITNSHWQRSAKWFIIQAAPRQGPHAPRLLGVICHMFFFFVFFFFFFLLLLLLLLLWFQVKYFRPRTSKTLYLL